MKKSPVDWDAAFLRCFEGGGRRHLWILKGAPSRAGGGHSEGLHVDKRCFRYNLMLLFDERTCSRRRIPFPPAVLCLVGDYTSLL